MRTCDNQLLLRLVAAERRIISLIPGAPWMAVVDINLTLNARTSCPHATAEGSSTTASRGASGT